MYMYIHTCNVLYCTAPHWGALPPYVHEVKKKNNNKLENYLHFDDEITN